MKSLMIVCLSSRIFTILFLTVQSLIGTLLLQEILLKTLTLNVGYQAKAEEAVVTKYCAAYPPMKVTTDKGSEVPVKANGTAKDLVLGKPQKVNLYCMVSHGPYSKDYPGDKQETFLSPITIEPFKSPSPDQLKIFQILF